MAHPGTMRSRAKALATAGAVLSALALGSATTATASTPDGTGSPDCGYDTRGIPGCDGAVYVGAAHGSNSDPSALEAELGHRLGVHRTYFTGSGVTKAVAQAKADHTAGRLPWISFKLPYSWSDMVAGKGDAWARDLANRMAQLDGPVWVAFHHEPEGDGDIQTWRKMQERLAPIVRNAAPNVGFTVILTGWHEFYGESKYQLSKIWPQGVEVDVAGFDIYQKYGTVKSGSTVKSWTDFQGDYFAKIAPWAESVDTHWALAETGETDAAVKARPSEMKDLVTQMSAMDGIAYAYFDTTLNSIANWSLSTTAKKQAFGSALEGSAVIDKY